MSKLGRKPSRIPKIRTTVYVRKDLYDMFADLHFDNNNEKITFGAFSEFVNISLAKYLEGVKYDDDRQL